jgi:hypothetical protein
MKEPQDAGKYQVDNDGTVQGQIIGDNPIVHQHYYATQDTTTPSTKPQRVWNIPYLRNEFFTGREEILVVSDLPSEQIWPSNLSTCPQM